MNISIYTVGKLKERFFRDAAAEYTKRLSRYCHVRIIEVPDEKTPEHASVTQKKQITQKEGQRLLAKISSSSYVIALAIPGRSYTSEKLAAHISDLTLHGRSELAFVIGGSLGLSDEVLQRADEQISFSDLTFPHQLMRVILLEQIYRCFRINHGEPYHK
ncbi:MAG: 23S rRNA (pseudouridine(1915)-N(3))-methyltransferase RlmH [Eubacterium sp.]|jgi:23S rRNA (pseudouridine1915-N3)-methyltransferase